MNEWLYRRNNLGKPTKWRCHRNGDKIEIQYGVVCGALTTESYDPKQKYIENEIKSRYNDKYKVGYRPIDEIVDDHDKPPVGEGDESSLYRWLDTYLSYDRYSAEGTLLPMLAKTFDNATFKRVPYYYGQWKINGLRCIITAKPSDDMFSPYKFVFQSREGTYWKGFDDLASYLFNNLPTNIINKMINDGWALDGEIYLPGNDINQINHYVKDTTCPQHKILQFWCYDIIIPDATQYARFNYLYDWLGKFKLDEHISYNGHLNNTNIFNVLPYFNVDDASRARNFRDKFINAGFEGLILRNPDAEYQFGKRRAGIMVKYKDAKEGNFKIIDIYPEKTRNLPILLCQNDINDECFETRLSTSHSEQELVLNNREAYIGSYVHINYGERSGIKRAPFHITQVTIN